MVWRQGRGAASDQWTGPMKVVVHENAQTVWTTMATKLYRAAPEHIRPVSAMEAKRIVILPNEPSVSTIAQQLPSNNPERQPPQIINNPPHDVTLPPSNNTLNNPIPQPLDQDLINNPNTQSEAQPDAEPCVPGSTPRRNSRYTPEYQGMSLIQNRTWHANTWLRTHPCQRQGNVEPESFNLDHDQAWQCAFDVHEDDIEAWKNEDHPEACGFLATAAKRQRAEVKLTTLSPTEKAEFQKAKENEISNWLKTGTISRILRDKVPPDQILRCRWILTWKPIDQQEKEQLKGTKDVKAKARLVILGYLDPKIAEVPRDSPTLGRHSKMLLLQVVASMGWDLRSFDIKAAFLQGKNQKDRVLAIEPVAEIINMIKLKPREICKLEKGAYGLVDAPYMWFQAILEELLGLGFEQSPFDPCLFILRDQETLLPDGILGLHVDDGLCAGNNRFSQKTDLLEKKYPFGTKRVGQFTFTGIDVQQTPDGTIHLSQSKYICAIEPIKINTDGRSNLTRR